ncbi:hypothetical protein Nepgr_008034 [Nepenthes gracilis]|uniref:Uncharacterized protein n=1 Tax=Nepenthes gracilis TaxID=150966 RepID=A0AAD3XIW5_NEPGR|nr:hypothetical protein Nepgr_008034 [Nepenthes gracilis]
MGKKVDGWPGVKVREGDLGSRVGGERWCYAMGTGKKTREAGQGKDVGICVFWRLTFSGLGIEDVAAVPMLAHTVDAMWCYALDWQCFALQPYDQDVLECMTDIIRSWLLMLIIKFWNG